MAKLDATLRGLAQASAAGAVVASQSIGNTHVAPKQLRTRTDSPRVTSSVLVNITVKGDPKAALASLQRVELRDPSVYSNLISGWIPSDRLADAAALGNVATMRASLAQTNTGSVTTQGDVIQHSDLLRASSLVPGLLGSGITVGVLSDSFNCLHGYGTDVSTGDLPAAVKVLEDDGGTPADSSCAPKAGGTDEGRAMAQVIYDVAPGSKLAFHTAFNGEANFANGIIALAAAGAKVITDDISYFDEPTFQDGIVGQAIDTVSAGGAVNIGGVTVTIPQVPYFSSAGNNARQSYDAPWVDSGTVGATGADNAGEHLMQFTSVDGASKQNFLPFTVPGGGFQSLQILQWDQPYVTGAPDSGGATSSIDICVTDETGAVLPGYCSGPVVVGTDPVAITGLVSGGADFVGGIEIGLVDGTPPPNLIKVNFADDGVGTAVDSAFATNSGTIQGHPLATGAAAIGATYWRHTPYCSSTLYPTPQLEFFSSAGGDPILFDVTGTRLSAPVVRQKPNFVAPDGGATTFFGGNTGPNVIGGTNPACDIPPFSFLFRGTSEAAPHAAGVAALLLQAQPKATPQLIYKALSSTTVAMTNPPGAADYDSGFGLIQADAALPQVLPGISVSKKSVHFPAKDVGTTSANPILDVVTNTGGYPLTIKRITSAKDFPATNDCPLAPATLAPLATCTVTINFSPTTAGDLSESITIVSDAISSPTTIALSGSSLQPALTVTPASLSFNQPRQYPTGFGIPQTVTLASTGNGPVIFAGISVTGAFIESNNCPAELAVGDQCEVKVSASTTTPSSTNSGRLLIASNATNQPFAVPLKSTITDSDSGGAMPFWLILPGLGAFLARRRKHLH